MIYRERMDDYLIDDIILEASNNDSYIIRDEFYPLIDKVLSTPEGPRKFSRLVGEFVNKNNAKLTTIGPMHLIPFTMADKQKFYDLFNLKEEDINKVIKKVTSTVNDKANWLLMKQNPIFILFYCVIRYFTINRKPKELNSALVITALAFYPSMYSKYFRFDPNPGVMQYTIDNLSKRFMIKKTNHIFGTLTNSIQNSWKFLEKSIITGSDKECIRFVQRIRNDQNSLLKKIANNYHENHKKGLTVTTTVDQYDDAIVVDNINDTNRVELITRKIVMGIIVNGINLKLCDFAANAASISKIELRNYLTKIVVDKRTQEIESFVESILFIYLYDGKHTVEEINSKEFISFALATFKRTNSKNDNINNIKNILDKWGEDTGLYARYTRLASRVDYTKGIYLYFIMSIQKYN